jgi:hypothetical protein
MTTEEKKVISRLEKVLDQLELFVEAWNNSGVSEERLGELVQALDFEARIDKVINSLEDQDSLVSAGIPGVTH